MKKKLATGVSGWLSACMLLVLTLTGCSDDSAGKREAWARTFCDLRQPQAEKIAAAHRSIAEVSEREDATPEEVKEVDVQAYQDLSEAYAALSDALGEAGDPPVEDGAQLREDAQGELQALSDAYEGLQSVAEELDTSDRAKFAEGLRELAGKVEELTRSGDAALSELQSGRLGEALAAQPSCQTPTPGPPDTGDTGDTGDTEGTGDSEGSADTEGSGNGGDGGDDAARDESEEDPESGESAGNGQG
ncbi:small secreted protein [Streptomyces sp. YIM 98790]|uniref:small secreted protein n=1 Tax=Streptomyces sp. YIM 98790 TaxID=2689077 RepID=UPI00140967DE|nr:small secreted protein [Streptomyces sp. YIM 98790]